MKYGFERECFLLDIKGEVQTIPDALRNHSDGGGLQLEARGEPSESIENAWFSMIADHNRIERAVAKFAKDTGKVLTIAMVPIMACSRDRKRETRRKYSKDIISYENLYGFKDHRQTQTEVTAGLHISFTKEGKIWYGKRNNKSKTYNQIWDYPQIFIALDTMFKDAIRESKRNPGFYELKSNGRIEYRSLPNTVEINQILDVLSL